MTTKTDIAKRALILALRKRGLNVVNTMAEIRERPFDPAMRDIRSEWHVVHFTERGRMCVQLSLTNMARVSLKGHLQASNPEPIIAGSRIGLLHADAFKLHLEYSTMIRLLEDFEDKLYVNGFD